MEIPLQGIFRRETEESGRVTFHPELSAVDSVGGHDLSTAIQEGHGDNYATYNREYAEAWAENIYQTEGGSRSGVEVTGTRLPKSFDDSFHRVQVCDDWKKLVFCCRLKNKIEPKRDPRWTVSVTATPDAEHLIQEKAFLPVSAKEQLLHRLFLPLTGSECLFVRVNCTYQTTDGGLYR